MFNIVDIAKSTQFEPWEDIVVDKVVSYGKI